MHNLNYYLQFEKIFTQGYLSDIDFALDKSNAIL